MAIEGEGEWQAMDRSWMMPGAESGQKKQVMAALAGVGGRGSRSQSSKCGQENLLGMAKQRWSEDLASKPNKVIKHQSGFCSVLKFQDSRWPDYTIMDIIVVLLFQRQSAPGLRPRTEQCVTL